MNIHPARKLSFAELFAALEDAYASGLVIEVANGNNLVLFHSAPDCEDWRPICRMATGLIIDSAAEELVATPFPKVFELDDPRVARPSTYYFRSLAMPVGEMVTVFFHHGEWCAAGAEAFDTPVADWCHRALFGADVLARDAERVLAPGATYIFDVVEDESPILFGCYSTAGTELKLGELRPIAGRLGLPVVAEYVPNDLVTLHEQAGRLPADVPGFLLLFDDGERRSLSGAAWKAAQKARDSEAEPA